MCLLNMISEPTDAFDMRDVQWVEQNSVSSVRIGLLYLFRGLQAEFFVACYERTHVNGCQREQQRGEDIRTLGSGEKTIRRE